MGTIRPIEFRGIGINEGTFFYSMTVSNGTIKRKMNCVFLEVNGKWIGIEPETLGQFSELQDRHGKDIFEGDKLKFLDDDSCISTVKYKLGAFGMTWWENQKFPQWVTFNKISEGFNECDFELIGNIHEGENLNE